VPRAKGETLEPSDDMARVATHVGSRDIRHGAPFLLNTPPHQFFDAAPAFAICYL
jgi:hypothetical protein